MIRTLIAATLLFPWAVSAQGIVETCDRVAAMDGAVVTSRGGDRIVAAPQPDKSIFVCYENSGGKSSLPGEWSVPVSGTLVTGGIRVNAGEDGGSEGFTVIPPLGFMAWPADLADTDVPDGQSVEVLLIQGMM